MAGARMMRPILGTKIAVGGFDRAFVCVAGARAMADAMNFTRAGGAIVLLGNAVKLDGLDWTPLWMKELAIHGSLAYGTHAHGGSNAHAFEEAARLVAERRVDLAPLVTHVFPLADHGAALA